MTQHFQIISQKFVIEGQNQAEIFIYHPPSEAVNHLGNLYILGEIETFGQKENSRIILLNALASIIKKTYYSFIDNQNAATAFELTLKKANIHFKNTLKNFKGSLHIIVACVVGGRLFFAKSGKANIWLVRNGKWSLISQANISSKNHSGALFHQIFTGKITTGDFLIFVTPKIIPYIMQESFKIKVNSLPFESTLSFLKKNIKDVDPSASAAILKIDVKEAAFTPPLKAADLDNKFMAQTLPSFKTEQKKQEPKPDISPTDVKFINTQILKRFSPFIENKTKILEKFQTKKNNILFLSVVALFLISLIFLALNKSAIKKDGLKPQAVNVNNQNIVTPKNYLNLKKFNLTKLADLSSAGFLISPKAFINTGQFLAIFDKELLIKFNPKDNSLTTSFIDSKITQDNFTGALFPFTNNVYLALNNDPSNIILFDVSSKNSKNFKINFPKEVKSIYDIALYNSNLYFLTDDKSLVYKAPISLSFELNKPLKWLLDDSLKLGGTPLSLAVDTNLYILDSSGAINKFFKGKKVATFENQTGVPIGSGAKIFTDQTIKNIYITDPLNGRIIILSKDGKNYFQIVDNQLIGVRLITISSDETTIYAVNNNNLFQITF